MPDEDESEPTPGGDEDDSEDTPGGEHPTPDDATFAAPTDVQADFSGGDRPGAVVVDWPPVEGAIGYELSYGPTTDSAQSQSVPCHFEFEHDGRVEALVAPLGAGTYFFFVSAVFEGGTSSATATAEPVVIP